MRQSEFLFESFIRQNELANQEQEQPHPQQYSWEQKNLMQDSEKSKNAGRICQIQQQQKVILSCFFLIFLARNELKPTA